MILDTVLPITIVLLSIIIILMVIGCSITTPQLTPGPEPVKYSCSSELNECVCTQDGEIVSCLPSENASGDYFERGP